MNHLISLVKRLVGLTPKAGISVAIVIFLQSIAGVAENLSLVSLLPIIQTMITGEADDSGVGALIANTIRSIGLEPSLGNFIIFAVVAATLRATISIVAIRCANRLVLNTTTNLRKDLARRLYGLQWARICSINTGHAISTVISEIERIRPAFSQMIGLCNSIIQSVIYMSTSFLVSTPLTLLAILLGLSKAFLLRPLQKKARSGGQRLSRFTSEMNATLVESMQNMKMLKAMGLENKLLNRFQSKVDDYHIAFDDIQKSAVLMKVLDEYLTSLLLAGIFFFSAVILNVGIAEIAVIGVLMNRLMTQIGALQKAMHTINSHCGAIDAVAKGISEWPEPQQQKTDCEGPFFGFKSEIRLDGVSIGYEDKLIVENISMSLPAGRFYALTGLSGSGKTTFVDTILGLHPPRAGRILVDGKDMSGEGVSRWHNRIGYMPQESILFNGTILFNLLLDVEGFTRQDAKIALIAAEAWGFVAALPQGLDTVIAERGANLSGGQRQRLALARALIHAKDLLVVDEPTSALDESKDREICCTLRKISKDITVIAISHQPTIVDYADAVIQVEKETIRFKPKDSHKRELTCQ